MEKIITKLQLKKVFMQKPLVHTMPVFKSKNTSVFPSIYFPESIHAIKNKCILLVDKINSSKI